METQAEALDAETQLLNLKERLRDLRELRSPATSFPTAVTFQKKNDQNISGPVDGGVSTIQNALASWTNDCGSNVNLVYGGTTTTAVAANGGTVYLVGAGPGGGCRRWSGSPVRASRSAAGSPSASARRSSPSLARTR